MYNKKLIRGWTSPYEFLVQLNALFLRQRELNFNDEGIIFTVTVGNFKKCFTFRLK